MPSLGRRLGLVALRVGNASGGQRFERIVNNFPIVVVGFRQVRVNLWIGMSAKLKTLDNRLLARRCVGCGYDGALLRNGQAHRCARCGCDLRKRPARSYAEMEGLLGEPLAGLDPRIDPALLIRRSTFEQALVHRWLFFFVLAMVGLIAIACLAAAALSGV